MYVFAIMSYCFSKCGVRVRGLLLHRRLHKSFLRSEDFHLRSRRLKMLLVPLLHGCAALRVAHQRLTVAHQRLTVAPPDLMASRSNNSRVRIVQLCAAPSALPTSDVALDGGDVWSGLRVNKDELAETIDIACSTTIQRPIIAQYYPERRWLWRQWGGTVLRRVAGEVAFVVLFAAAVSSFFHVPGPHAAWRFALAESAFFAGVAKVWTLSATMATFTLSFFLSQSYSLWRSVYSITRRVQGRLNDISLLCATFADRDAESGSYTPEAEALLQTVARYVRLFHMLVRAAACTDPLASDGSI